MRNSLGPIPIPIGNDNFVYSISLANPWDPTASRGGMHLACSMWTVQGRITNSALECFNHDRRISRPRLPMHGTRTSSTSSCIIGCWRLGYSGSHGIRESLLNAYPVNCGAAGQRVSSRSMASPRIRQPTPLLRAPYPGILGTDHRHGHVGIGEIQRPADDGPHAVLPRSANAGQLHLCTRLNLGSEDTAPDWVHFDPTSSAPNNLVYAKNTLLHPEPLHHELPLHVAVQ